MLSGLAVAAVLVSLAVVGAAPTRDRAAAPSVPAMPRYYVTINGLPPNANAIVRSTRTGQTPASVSIPRNTEVATVAAAPSDREFLFAIVEPIEGVVRRRARPTSDNAWTSLSLRELPGDCGEELPRNTDWPGVEC